MWSRVEKKAGITGITVCSKCPSESKDLVIFTLNVNLDLVYILRGGMPCWCLLNCIAMMLNYFILSGNRVKHLVKCHHSLIFSLWNHVLYLLDVNMSPAARSCVGDT